MLSPRLLCPFLSLVTCHRSRFWRRRRQVARFDGGLKTAARMAAVAERFVGRLAAAAERNDFAPAESEGVAGGVFDDDVFAYNAQWAMVIADNYLIVLVAH